MVEQIRVSKTLHFLDPDLFEPSDRWDKVRFLETFECAICNGVVLKPLECSTSTCAMFYCEKCVNTLKLKECPRRCGSKVFHQPNKHMMRQLQELKFKCQYHPQCDQIVQYHMYEKHYVECKVGNQQCENENCKELEKRFLMMEAKDNEIKMALKQRILQLEV